VGALATISGVALVPGLSRNNRLYTPEIIGKAAKRMQERLSDPNGLPIVMRTHHEAGDDSARIVGRVTSVKVDNDSALRYDAELFDTSHGRTIASLVKPGGKQAPALRSVSIHGYWMGDPRSVTYQGEHATTADDLEIDAIDFTASPGVDRALIDAGGKARESVDGLRRVPISESMEATITVVEEGSGWADIGHTVKEGGVSMASEKELPDRWWIYEAKYSADDMKSLLAKGHAMKNASGEPSYPIADVSDLKKAIRAVGRGKASHDAVRKHIMKRAKALGQAALIPDNWNADGSMKEHEVRMGDITEYFGGDGGEASGFCLDAYSGPLSVSIRGCVSPDQLRAAAQAAAKAAMDAINVMDPDNDADIDVMGEAGGSSADDDMTDVYGESFATGGRVRGPRDDRNTITINVKPVMNEESFDLIRKQMEQLTARFGIPAPAETAAAGDAVAEMTLPPDDHGHTHDGADPHTHSHTHIHESEGDGPQYSHGHTHTHVHSSGDGPAHEHGHNHIHVTSPAATAETVEQVDNTLEESAVSETENTTAAEAAPTNRAFSAEDMKLLGETIGGVMAEAIRALGETREPKHAATTQETAEPVVPVQAAENAAKAGVEEKAPVDMDTLKESLARELRKELRDELRGEFLKENGLPPRRGYRLSENDEETVELTDAELFDKHRVDMLLGMYAKAPAPGTAA
jgi:hypothetical protein